jgi:uncharacterized protein (DUF433 family)
MMATWTATPTAHVQLDEHGRAWIDDTNIKVIEVVLDALGYGWCAEEISRESGGRLSLAQVHAALSYYYDNQAAFDAEIARQEQEYLAQRDVSLDSPGRAKLRALGKLP